MSNLMVSHGRVTHPAGAKCKDCQKVTIAWLIHNSNLIEGYDDPEFDAQGMIAWEHLLTVHMRDLDIGDIMKVQKIVTLKQTDLRPDWRGYFRKIPVWVGGREGLRHDLINKNMLHWCIQWNQDTTRDLEPKALHINFEKIHPFVDGNGRTGRLLMWWMELRLGRPFTEILFAERQQYYDWFRE